MRLWPSTSAAKHDSWPISVHLTLLIAYAIAILGLWMLPVLLAGFPYVLPDMVPLAQEFGETGLTPTGNGRLMAVLLSWFHPLVGWDNIIGWSFVSSIALALALIPWWWSVRRLFDARTAWIATLIVSLMPLYWIEALRLEGYSFALLFLSLGVALFLELQSRHRLLAVAAFALCFGLTLGSRDAFVTFLPWVIGAYIWIERTRWKHAAWEVVLFCAVAYTAFTLPLLFNVANTEGPLPTRLAQLLPSLERMNPTVGHFYPDEYTYAFDREAFEASMRARLEDASALERQQEAKILYHFGLQSGGALGYLKDSVWLFLNVIPSLFHQETVGGAFLWLFVLLGMLAMYAEWRRLFCLLIGLWLSTEFILRFVLHFGRHHLQDTGWMLALFAAIGVMIAATAIGRHWKQASVAALAMIATLLIAIQLVQTNRKQFAQFYARSDVPVSYAAGEVLEKLPSSAIVAHPRKSRLFFFSDRANVNIAAETVDRLSAEGRLSDPFTHYGVTHIIGYDEERARAIRRAVPRIRVVEIPESNVTVELTPLLKYLLHVVR